MFWFDRKGIFSFPKQGFKFFILLKSGMRSVLKLPQFHRPGFLYPPPLSINFTHASHMKHIGLAYMKHIGLDMGPQRHPTGPA